jgi:hypothetical protein
MAKKKQQEENENNVWLPWATTDQILTELVERYEFMACVNQDTMTGDCHHRYNLKIDKLKIAVCLLKFAQNLIDSHLNLPTEGKEKD